MNTDCCGWWCYPTVAVSTTPADSWPPAPQLKLIYRHTINSPVSTTPVDYPSTSTFKTQLSTWNQFTRFYYASGLSQHLNLNSFIDMTSIHPFLLLQWLSQHLNLNSFIDIKSIHPFLLLQWTIPAPQLNSFIDIQSIHPFQLLHCTIPAPQLKLIYRHTINSPVSTTPVYHPSTST